MVPWFYFPARFYTLLRHTLSYSHQSTWADSAMGYIVHFRVVHNDDPYWEHLSTLIAY
jgi:hypothetical protein